MPKIDQDEVRRLEEEYDPEMQTRPMKAPATWIVGGLLFILSCFHYYTAGFGLLREATHRGLHLSFVLGLIFLVYGFRKKPITNNEDIYEILLFLRNQGRIERGTFIHPEIGYNFRMTDIQMAIGLVQLRKFKQIVDKKLAILRQYQEELSEVKEVHFVQPHPDSGYIPFRVAIVCENAHELMRYLSEKGIQPRTFFYPLHRQPCYHYLRYQQEWWRRLADKYFPNAIYGYEHGVCLPSFAALTQEQVSYVCDKIKEFYRVR